MKTIKDLIGKEEFVVTGNHDELLQAEKILIKLGVKNKKRRHNKQSRDETYGGEYINNALDVFDDNHYMYTKFSIAILCVKPENIFTFPEFLQLIPE